MTDQAQATRVVPAGWYQDPASEAHVRWWNGLTWTEHVENKPERPAAFAAQVAQQAAIESRVASTTDGSIDQRIADARALEREFGIGTAENAVVTGSGSTESVGTGSVSTGSVSTGSVATGSVATGSRAALDAGRTSTGGAWLLALTPVFLLLLVALMGYLYFYVAPTPLVAIATVAFYLLGFLWATSDARTMRARGFATASPLWSLLTAPVYLIARRIKVRGNGPLVAFAVALVVSALGLGGLLLSGAAAPLSTALDVQRTLYDDLVVGGTATSVTCPPIVDDTTPGALFICDAVLPGGDTRSVIVTFDDAAGNFSYSLALR